MLMLTRRFLTAAYDGSLRIFSSSQELLHTIPAHAAPVLSATFATTSIIASGSQDRTGRLTRLNENGAVTFASLVLHTAPIASVVASSDGARILTAGWDGLVGVWDTNEPDADEVPADTLEEKDRSKKRRRVEDATPQPKRKVRAPLCYKLRG